MTIEINELFEKNIALLIKSFETALNDGLIRYDKKGELSNIRISFLLSSVLCKLPLLRIDLYDESDTMDMIECFSYWDVKPISDSLYQYESENYRIKDYELEQLWLEISNEYFKGFEKYLPIIIAQCNIKCINCRWHYGYFFGRTITVKES